MPDVANLSSTAETNCRFDTLGLANKPTCYTVTVPENWDDPKPDDQVELAVAVFSATDEANAVDDPLIYLDGGPGGNTLDTLIYSEAVLVEPYVAERDVIMFDQRGVGQSKPTLDCDEAAELSLEDSQGKVPEDEAADRWIGAYQACRDRLAGDGVDMTAYHSVASAHDVEAIRTGLGYDRLNLLGISYGTRLGQTIMRLYPASLRTVVLDSVVPVAANLHELVETSAERSLQLVFDACEADPGCSKEYPTFEDDYFALLDQLDAKPAEVEVTDLDRERYTFVVDGDYLVNLTFTALYDKSTFAALPGLVASAKDGDYDTIGALASNQQINSHFSSDGMHFAVECHEEVPFESREGLAANQPKGAPFNRLEALDEPVNYFDICDGWQAGAAPPEENEPVISDIPTLLLTGTFDPITPPAYAREVAGHLSTSYLFEFPTEGHGVAPSDCGADIVLAFLDDPNTAPDATCIDDVDPPVWTVGGGGGGEISLIPFEVDGVAPFSGVRPEGWEEAVDGTFLRQQSFDDPTAIVIQPSAGVGPDTLMPNMQGVFGVDFEEIEPTDIDGEAWRTFGGDDDSGVYRILFNPDNEFVMIFAASVDEFDELFATVAIPVATSLKLG